MKYKLKIKIFYKLAELRDHDWMPAIVVKLIDWIRYTYLWETWYD